MRLVFVGLFGLLPMAGFAQVATPPKGCEAFLTVQMKECSVSLYWRCEGAPEGTVWEASYDDQGPFSVHTYDRDYQWLDSYYFDDGTSERLYEPGPDPISLSELLETGTDTYTFQTREVNQYIDRVLTHSGKDMFAGRIEQIDGVDLKLMYVESRTVDDKGELVFQTEGFQYVLEDERLFFLGPDINTDGVDEWESNNAPVDFIYPGEPGFAQMTPLYGCSEVLSSAPGGAHAILP